jgi:quercetin dioxygenase-like cupin family protein
MFGQRASSQTVWRLAPWINLRTSKYCESALGARTFIHGGRRGRSATGSDFTPGSLRTRRYAASVPEAPLRETKYGLVADEEGWFVVNVREARWRERERLGSYCDFEGKKPFPQLGINVSVLEPGESLGRYHRENGQEGFLVLAGRCVLIVEDEERELRAWDFIHCPPQTDHMIVAAGDGPAVVLAVGARGLSRKGLVYPVSDTAKKYGVSVEKETTKPAEAYADLPRSRRVAYREGWLPGR